ncbi:unnamed protein product [Cuscuta campestris]|uniref:DUF7725 domain-containing protein n=1 Tax=Cuscuta campestris TaxID=132261 RepID=A0A484LWR9_9ASTE|nr:unnamed protein product [Cuscuta campestris]
MEAAAGVATARNVSTPVSSPQPSRKEWRVVSDHSERSDKERSKFGQSDERLIYEVQQGRNPSDVGFCSLILDGGPDNDLLQQRLHTVVNQREELQRMETELQAQLIAKTEMLEMRNTFDAQVKEQANTNAKLQEQLQERGETIYELERRLEEKERELHAIRLDNEAQAWAKEDLFREQSKELQTYMRERDNSEAERAQYIKQIHDFQEHIQEKERQFLELQEQNRLTQENIVYRDEQMREAQAWMSRFQEIEALQQAELRERTEQCNQLWLGCQRQAAEMERLHLHIQQLQAELTEAKERNNTISDGSQVSKSSSKDTAQIGKRSSGLLLDSGKDVPGVKSGHSSNGHDESDSSLSAMNASTQNDHLHGLSLAPSSLLGMPTYISPGQITALHPFLMHQQGIPPVPQSHVVHFHSLPGSAMPSVQHWPNQQVAPDGSELSSHNQSSLQTDSTLLRSNSSYQYETSVNGNGFHSEHPDANIIHEIESPDSVAHSNEGEQKQTLQYISSQIHNGLRLDPNEQKNEFQVDGVNSSSIPGIESQGSMIGEITSPAEYSPLNILEQASNSNEKVTNSSANTTLPESMVSMGQKNAYPVNPAEPILLDEQSLLACIVRTIPPGSSGQIRISTTLPNRLAKMLAPLHWHDYKKKYGKLDDFVASHPELFVVDDDYIQLREGAQEIIAATAAVAKVAAATAVPSLYPSRLHSVAVTPMAQSHRLKKNADAISQSVAMQSQHSNSSCSVGEGITNVKNLAKPRGPVELNASETHPAQLPVGNGIHPQKNDLATSQIMGSSHGRGNVNVHGKHRGRITVLPSNSRR